MANREDLVYQAKLAEQAERYDGKMNFKEEQCYLNASPVTLHYTNASCRA